MKYQSLRRTGVIILILSLLAIIQAPAATYYVWTNSPSDGPGTTWDTAYHTIQGAVDAATDGDTVLVTNGVYDQGSNKFGRFRVCEGILYGLGRDLSVPRAGRSAMVGA
jgi:hypothetical protein